MALETHDIPPEDELAIAAFMRRLAAVRIADHRLPDAYVVWWKAELVRRWNVERKAAAPLDVIEPLQWVGGLAAAALLLAWMLPSLLRSVTF